MSDNQGQVLLAIARASISTALGQPGDVSTDVNDAAWLQEKAACFVTLMKQGQLRGCIGTIDPYRSLLDDIKHNACAAAFNDSRFPTLTLEELGDIDIEISLLSALSELKFSNQQDALAQLRPGIDGVIFECDQHRSTFLPQVWQQLPNTADFMAQLKRKAGLSGKFWRDDVKIFCYTVTKWKENRNNNTKDA